MKKLALVIITAGIVAIPFKAQTSVSKPRKSSESFQEFRNRIKGNYSNFKKTILDHYADFLNGEWVEYESLNGLIRNETPKPEVIPSVDGKQIPPGKTVDTPEEETTEQPPAEAIPAQRLELETTAVMIPEPEFVAEAEEIEEPELVAEAETIEEVEPELVAEAEEILEPELIIEPDFEDQFQDEEELPPFIFPFYEIPMQLVDLNFSIEEKVTNPQEFAAQWKNLSDAKVADKLIPGIKELIDETGFNDYLTYKLLESYANAKFPEMSEASRLSLVHFLLVNLGYDVRIAVSELGTPIMLLPFQKTIYGNPYILIQDKKYYLFLPEGYDATKVLSEKIMTCQLPPNTNTGNIFNLVLGELRIPEKPKPFDLQYGPLHLTGEINENLMPILYRYPQMPIEDYAVSVIQPELREKISEQIREQLAGMEGDSDVEALLKFTQSAFDYATDDAYHGFEKPYFVEETLYYPKNDCEDRAIFYTYFLRNALGRETQLISYPGHEAATVILSQPYHGVYYDHEGKKYYISDPTYLGAGTGMVMPQYQNVLPNIDYTYPLPSE